jgi:hypothetical protein
LVSPVSVDDVQHLTTLILKQKVQVSDTTMMLEKQKLINKNN